MKRLKYAILLFLITLTTNSQGDIIITKPLTRNTNKIVNLNDYPEITLFVVYKNPFNAKYKHLGFSRVLQNGLINKHIFCQMEIFAVKNNYLKDKEDKEIDWEDKRNVTKSNITLQPDLEEAEIPGIREIEHDYTIVGLNDTTMMLQKTKQIFKHTENLPDSIKYIEYEGNLTNQHNDVH